MFLINSAKLFFTKIEILKITEVSDKNWFIIRILEKNIKLKKTTKNTITFKEKQNTLH